MTIKRPTFGWEYPWYKLWSLSHDGAVAETDRIYDDEITGYNRDQHVWTMVRIGKGALYRSRTTRSEP